MLSFPFLPKSTVYSANMLGSVAQERLLSPRTIHYDIDQLMWECKQARLTEDGIPTDVDIDATQATSWDGRFQLKYPYQLKDSSISRDFVWDWYAMVDNYTTRNLTNSEDKLPALSGIANVMASRTGQRYAAGLWESHLYAGLLWQRSAPSPWLKAPGKYRAPSWSWAAYDGVVIMQLDTGLNSSSNPFRSMVETNNLEIIPLGLDPHGRLKFASLTVTAKLKQIDPRVDPTSITYRTYPEDGSGQDHLWDHGESIGCVNFDEDYRPGGKALFCLQMTERRYPRRVACHCLVLEYTGVGNDFKRVGLGHTGLGDLRPGWFNDAETRRIRLI